MSDSIYELMRRIGYLHPLHPSLVHMPIGFVVGAFLLSWAAILYKPAVGLMRSAYVLLVLAFLFWFPTVLFGYMDWQRYYAGAMLHDIKMKLALSAVLFVLLVTGLLLGRKGERPRSMVAILTLSVAVVTALGFFGGDLVYTGVTPAGHGRYHGGERLFETNCSGCHARGGNVMMPNLPLWNAPQLDQPDDFVAFLRKPSLPDGRPGAMPAFDRQRLSDQDARRLYDYVVHAVAKPDRAAP